MEYIYLIIVYLLILNSVATYRLLKSDLYETYQKVFQSIFIWILPLVGALIVSTLLNQLESVELKKKTILKSIIYFIFLVKIKNNSKKKLGYSETDYNSNKTNTLDYHSQVIND